MDEIIVEQPTPEEIARHYSAAMDSVNLLNAGKPEEMTDVSGQPQQVQDIYAAAWK